MKNSPKKTEWTLLLALIGLAGGLYVFALSLYIIKPFWRKDDSPMVTILLAVVALCIIFCVMLYKRQNGVEERLAATKRSLERAKKALNEKRRTK